MTTTSPAPGSGTGTSRTSVLPLLDTTTVFIVAVSVTFCNTERIESRRRVPHSTRAAALSRPSPKIGHDLTMSEHTMPAPIASTATSAPGCTDCLPGPSTSTSASTSAAPPPDVSQQAALLDASTFEPPALGSSDGEAPRVVIEFCDRCRYAQLVARLL